MEVAPTVSSQDFPYSGMEDIDDPEIEEDRYNGSIFFNSLDSGFPKIQLYGPSVSEEERKANAESLRNAEALKYSPAGFEKISEWLEEPMVKVAITVAAIAALCWFCPTYLVVFSNLLVKPLRWLNNTAYQFLDRIPIVNLLTTRGHPIIQLTVAICTLVAITFFSENAQKGAAASLLTLSDKDLILERVTILLLGMLINPKSSIAGKTNGNTYHSKILMMVFAGCITIPIIEEWIFRIVIPQLYEEGIRLAGKAIMHITDIEITKDVKWFSDKTTPIVSSVIFGAVHFRNDHFQSFAQALYCGWSAIRVMHPLSEKVDVTAAIGEHMTNNSIALFPLVIFSSLADLIFD